jgi:foldase protein PrsA
MKKTSTPDVQTTEVVGKKPDSLARLLTRVRLKCKKPKPFVVTIVVIVVLIGSALFYFKGLFVAVMVNGSPISRLAVVSELEKQGGKQTLDSLITQKLINSELKKQNINITQADIDDEIKKIETQVTSQGGTLQQALDAQGMSEEKLREQIALQKGLEKLLADKIAVSDAEIDAYIKDNKIAVPKDVKEEDFRKQISDQLQQQKFQQEAKKWIDDQKTNAKINYFVNY